MRYPLYVAHLVSTMETASFRTDSPNTSMFSVGSTSRAWNIASVATGSTAEIRLPNVKLKQRNTHIEHVNSFNQNAVCVQIKD